MSGWVSRLLSNGELVYEHPLLKSLYIRIRMGIPMVTMDHDSYVDLELTSKLLTELVKVLKEDRRENVTKPEGAE